MHSAALRWACASLVFLALRRADATRFEVDVGEVAGYTPRKHSAGGKIKHDTVLTLASVDEKCSVTWKQTLLVNPGGNIHMNATSSVNLVVSGCGGSKYGFHLHRHAKTITYWDDLNKSSTGKEVILFTFRARQQNRRFVLEVTDHAVIEAPTIHSVLHLYIPTSPRCEGGQEFTKPSLECSAFPAHMIPKDNTDLLKRLKLSSLQAYAVEFEGVLRRPPISSLPKEAVGRWATFDKKNNGLVRKLVDTYFATGTWKESVGKLEQTGNRGHYQKVSEGFYFPALQECFTKVISSTFKEGGECKSPRTCGFAGFCSTGKNRHRLRGHTGTCKARKLCVEDGASVACPKPLSVWPWMFDSSVSPMTASDTSDADQWDGVPVEIVAPGPPKAWPLRGGTGLRNIGEMMASLRWMGLQMGPSTGMHVHVNIKSTLAGGDCCMHDKQVARIWTAFAKYQLVIDEMMTSSRVTNAYAVGLLLGDARIAAIFANIHDYFNGIFHHNKTDGTPDFCNSALGVTRDPLTLKKTGLAGAWGTERGRGTEGKVCQRKGDERYTSLNVHALGKHGTIEFRSHAGTHDIERVLRWVQFVIAFCHAYRNSFSMDKYFDDDVLMDWQDLYQDQLIATPTQLYSSIFKYAVLDKASKAYHTEHKWAEKCPMVADPDVFQVTVNKGYTVSPLIQTIKRSPGIPPQRLRSESYLGRQRSESHPRSHEEEEEDDGAA